MHYKKLGTTDLDISLIGLGTMTWGEQNTESEAHQQLDYALSRGVNFVDTAEMYPVPPRAKTQGLTEQYIGTWLKKTQKRQDIVLASKVAGPPRKTHNPTHIRDGFTYLDRKNMTAALDESLKRLQTDYLDLYQLHWPDRTTTTFGDLAYPWKDDEFTVTIAETLEVLNDFVKAGKIRYVGVSNETAWGVAQYLNEAKNQNLPRIMSIQNPYSLVNRTFELGLSEFSHRDQVGLLAYSPLAFGMLSGKYLGGARPEGARITLFSRFSRYSDEYTQLAIRDYADLAKRCGLSLTHLSLAFVNQQAFTTSNIIGATNLEQLKENIDSVDVHLDDKILEEIERIHRRYPNPAP